MLEHEFERAVQNERYRQQFLDLIVQRGLPPYIQKVTYSPVDLESRRKIFRARMATLHHFLTQWYIPGTKSIIEVYPCSFSLESSSHQRVDDFLSTLEDHEYHHAREYYEHPSLIVRHRLVIGFQVRLRTLVGEENRFRNHVTAVDHALYEFENKLEIRALENQCRNFPNRNCSAEYRLAVISELSVLDPTNLLVRR